MLNEQGHCLQGEETLGIVCTGVSGEELFSVCLFFPVSSFPYCSALYDDVVVHRVYSELALGWTSKPLWTLSCSLGFIRTGLVAVSCKCIVVSFPAFIEKQQLFSFSTTSTPFQPGISA